MLEKFFRRITLVISVSFVVWYLSTVWGSATVTMGWRMQGMFIFFALPWGIFYVARWIMLPLYGGK